MKSLIALSYILINNILVINNIIKLNFSNSKQIFISVFLQLVVSISMATAKSVDLSKKQSLDEYSKVRWDLSRTQKRYLLEHKVLADAEVKTFDSKMDRAKKLKRQSFNLKALALHTKNCTKALRKLSMLEEYKNWIGFIKRSDYNEINKLFTLSADHPLLPYPMRIHIIVNRPTKEGLYNFTFPTGLFRGLKGFFEIKEFNNKCLFYASSNWEGRKTKLPDFVIELFSETLSKIGGELLMRKTK